MPVFLALFIALFGCSAVHAQPEAFPSTYTAPPSKPVLFRNATILTGDGKRHDNTDLYIEAGRVGWIGEGETAPETLVVDASDRWITPGLIDVHSHLGVYPSCLLYTSPSPRDVEESRMPSSA